MVKTEILQETIAQKIYLIRGQKIMLDKDLAKLYGVETKHLKRQVRRNIERFPSDFMFELSKEELKNWRRQIGTSNSMDKMGLRYRPYAFTDYGILMLSSVLNSELAIQVNIAIMRVFVRLRQIFSTHKELVVKLNELEQKSEKHDGEIKAIFDVIHQLMEPISQEPKRKIGFHNI
ncbi:MAG: ORF6N domain-containing protein [Candidatus Omnitrophota bacterium]|jgi:hypothetical protein